jgi:hypothetical protein
MQKVTYPLVKFLIARMDLFNIAVSKNIFMILNENLVCLQHRD